MNFLIQSTTLNYKINHRIAVHLNKLYPASRFGVIISSHGDKKRFLEEQTDVPYEFVHDVSNLESEFLNEPWSSEELAIFEESIPEKSLWRFIAMDRYWGRAFCKGASQYFDRRERLDAPVTEESILRVAYGYSRYFTKILTEFDADVVLFFPGFHSMMNPILEQCCKNLGVIHVAIVGARLKNHYSISPDSHCTFPHIEETYRQIVKGEIEIDLSPGEQCYEELMTSASGGQGYSYHSEMVSKIFANLSKKKGAQPGYGYLLAKSVAVTTIEWYRNRKLQREKINGIGPYNLKYYYSQVIHDLLLNYQRKKLVDPKFYDHYDPTAKYLYYPLTGQPEYATQVRENMWINQLSIIEALAKSVPFDWKIYVKEHPGTVGWRVRPFSFYKELRSYPNVRLIPIYLENSAVVKNAQMVVSITSSAGWENFMFHGKPSISFGNNLYNVTDMSAQCSDLSQLSRLIHDEYKRVNAIHPEERKKQLVALVNAILLHSFALEDPLKTFTGNVADPSSDREFNKNAEIIAMGIQRYIGSSLRTAALQEQGRGCTEL